MLGFAAAALVLGRSKPAKPDSSPVSLPQTSPARHPASVLQAVAVVTLQCASEPSGSVVGPNVV